MNILFAALAIIGYYFFLGRFQSLHSVAFSAMGANVSWFLVVFAVGCLLIFRFAFGKK